MKTFSLSTHIEHCGNEILDNLRQGFTQLGGFVESDDNPDYAFFVGNGGNLEDPSGIPAKNKILLLTENIPVDMETPNNIFKMFLLERFIHVWDYILLMDYGVDIYLKERCADRMKAKCILCNYVSILEKNISSLIGNDGNGCFIGQIDGRREEKIVAMRDKGIIIEHITEIGLNDWAERVANCSYMFNIHYDDSIHNELLRIYFGMATDCLVITEKIVEPEVFGLKHDHNIYIVDNMDNVDKNLLDSIDKNRIVENAHKTVRDNFLPIKVVQDIMSALT